MPSSGHTWRQPFPGLPEQALTVRDWVRAHLAEHAASEGIATDAELMAEVVLLAHELFLAVLATRPEKVQMTLSTSGSRARVYAAGPFALPLRARVGTGIVRGLAMASGSQDDSCTVWAEARIGRPR